MTKTTIKSFLNNESPSLQPLMVRIEQLKRWNTWLLECLPEESTLLAHCHIVRLNQSTLIVLVDNAHWATRFRFFIPQLLTILRRYPDFQGIKDIQCKIVPPRYLPQHSKLRANKLSTESAKILLETAEQIKDQQIRSLLEKMALSSKK